MQERRNSIANTLELRFSQTHRYANTVYVTWNHLTSPGRETNIHYDDVIMGAMASQITSLTIVYSTVYSDADQRKHQSSASLAFVRRIHRGPVNSPHKWPVTRKMSPFDDVVMMREQTRPLRSHVTACLLGAEPSSEPMMLFCYLNSREQLQAKFSSRLPLKNLILKCCLRNGGHFSVKCTCLAFLLIVIIDLDCVCLFVCLYYLCY